MGSSQGLPQWLATATQSTNYIEEAWRILHARETRRSHARSSSRSTRLHRAFSRTIPLNNNIEQALVARYSIASGSSVANRCLNRYYDIIPYDYNRVKPPSIGSQERYLNASWVQERAGGKWWIASQAPLPYTANAFLSLLTVPAPEPQSHGGRYIRTIVQLTSDVEGGIRKADRYFPTVVGDTWVVSADDGCPGETLEITLRAQSVVTECECVQSLLSIRTAGGPNANEREYLVNHLLYTAWPDHGVPEETSTLLRFMRHVDRINREGEGDPPIVAGCSAGIGRTGCFIATSSLLRAYALLGVKEETGSSDQNVSPLGTVGGDLVVQEVDWLREQRPGMVQREEQLELVYGLVKDAYSDNNI